MKKPNNLLYHLIAIATVIVWGTTFVSTKILINEGLSPIEIMLYRFVIAYLCIWTVSYRKLWANSLKDELLLLLSGICGGSLFFLAQNSAVGITLASNVSLLTCTAPIMTTVLCHLFFKEPLKRSIIYGTVVALVGVTLVVFNGSILLKLNPLGDLLAFLAAIMWAFFSILLKRLGEGYSSLFINRKVFFYGIITLMVYLAFRPLHIDTVLLAQPKIYLNLLFLGVFASMLGNIMWTTAIQKLGASKASNYIYFNPVITLITSIIVLHEGVTAASLIGALCIIVGVYMADRSQRR